MQEVFVMELHKWSGHIDQAIGYLASLPNARLVFLKNGEDAALLYETAGAALLPDVDVYQILDASGDINSGYFTVFNNIPVTAEGRERFEELFNNRARMIEKEPGFEGIRVLRPMNSDTYVILTLWIDEKSFMDWQQSDSYGNAHAKRGTAEGIDKVANIFPRPSYVTTYVR